MEQAGPPRSGLATERLEAMAQLVLECGRTLDGGRAGPGGAGWQRFFESLASPLPDCAAQEALHAELMTACRARMGAEAEHEVVFYAALRDGLRPREDSTAFPAFLGLVRAVEHARKRAACKRPGG